MFFDIEIIDKINNMKDKNKLLVTGVISLLTVLGVIICRRYFANESISDDDFYTNLSEEDFEDEYHGVEYFAVI